MPWHEIYLGKSGKEDLNYTPTSQIQYSVKMCPCHKKQIGLTDMGYDLKQETPKVSVSFP